MKALIFTLLVAAFAFLSFFRPVYELPYIFKTTNDFETCVGWSKGSNGQFVCKDRAYSGEYSSKIEGLKACSYIFHINSKQLPSNKVNRIKVKARVLAIGEPKGLYVVLQCQKGEAIFTWLAQQVYTKNEEWILSENEFQIDKQLTDDDDVAVYFWNKESGETVYVDDFEVTFY